MFIESKHWTDDQLIACLYGVGPEDGHLETCAACRSRLSQMQSRQQAFLALPEEVAPERLAAQRRRVYDAIARHSGSDFRGSWRRWAPATAAAVALAGSLLYYSQQQQQHARENTISDAQLAQDVSRLAENPEALPTAPLQGLFVE